MPHKKIFTAAKVLVGVLVIVWLLSYVGFEEVLTALGNVPIIYLILALVLMFITALLGSLNILLLLQVLKRKVSYGKVFVMQNLSWAIGIFLPGKLGEFSLVYFLKQRAKISIGRGLAIAFMDKMITFGTLLFFALFGLFAWLPFWQALLLFGVVLGGFGVSFLLFFYPQGSAWIKTFLPERWMPHLTDFQVAASFFWSKGQATIAANTLITFFKWMISALQSYLLFLALGVSISYWQVLVITAATVIISLVPVSLSGLGIRESAGVYFFSQVGVNPSFSLAVLLINLIGQYFFAVIFLVIFPRPKGKVA